jgi:CheY-like chemotaxis protein
MQTVLILEDDLSNRQIFSALLRSEGYKVLEASSGDEAIETGKRHYDKIDLLVSDVSVPERSGTEVALELITSHPAMVILFVSGTPIYGWNRSDLNNFRQLPPDHVDVLKNILGDVPAV